VTIHRVNDISIAIADATEEQGARDAGDCAQRSGTVQRYSGGSGEHRALKASRPTSASAAQVLSAASELAKNGERLRHEVSQFFQMVRAAQ
jgi:methyl-accepting chemotaxis protein